MTESLFQASNTNGVASSIALKIPDPIGKERTYSTSVPSVSISFRGESGLSHAFLGMGPVLLELGKLAAFGLRFGKIYIVYMYEISIARLIQIINLT